MQNHEYLGVDVYPNGSFEILCCNKNFDQAQNFIKSINNELTRFPGVKTSIDYNRGADNNVNGMKVIVHNSIKEKNRTFQNHVIKTLDKFSVDYSNTGINNLKKIIDTEKINSRSQDQGMSM